MRLSERVDKLEDALVRHLEESGTIRTDLAWLKKAFWVLAVAYIGALASNVVKTGYLHAEQNMSSLQQKP